MKPFSHELATGYASLAYARTCTHLGAPRELPRSGVSVLVRAVAAPFAAADACASYPLLRTGRWHELAADLAGTRDLVSFVAVVDPLAAPPPATLASVFPDRLVEFKTHHVARLAVGQPLAHVVSGHRRKAERAGRTLTIEVAAEPAAHAADWVRLYGALRDRHAFTGAADFPDIALAAQLALPGMLAVLALEAARVVSMSLWLIDGPDAHYHLGASDAAGYAAGASFATFARAFEVLADRGVECVDLGGSAGPADAPDGLARFKQGWAPEARTAWLGGRVLDRTGYERLAGADPASDHFPAYRARVVA